MGECIFWYRLTWLVPDKIQRAVKQLCVVYLICNRTLGTNTQDIVFVCVHRIMLHGVNIFVTVTIRNINTKN